MLPEYLHPLLSLVLGFSVAGLVCSGYQLVADRPATFHLLDQGPRPATIAAVPFLVFAAPFIIMRNAIRGDAAQQRRFEFVMMTTILAGLWSLMSGTVVAMAVEVVSQYII